MNVDIQRQIIRPLVVPVLAFLLAAFLIIAIGETLLRLFDSDVSSELRRRELWFGVFLSLAFLGAGAAAVLIPQRSGKKGILDREVVVGKQAMFDATASVPVSAKLRAGERGAVADIAEGYTLYARNGEFAKVIGMLPGGVESGRTFRGYIYAEGMRGAGKELWIPVEAVLDVFPDSKSAFLAIMGDETEAFGWNQPPQSFNRALVINEPPKTL